MDMNAVNDIVVPEGRTRRIRSGGEVIWKNYRKYAHTFEELDLASLPSRVLSEQGTTYHRVFDGSQLMFSKVEGKTVKYNQLFPMLRDRDISTKGINVKYSEGFYSIKGTATETDQIDIDSRRIGSFPYILDHVYYFGNKSGLRIVIGGYGSAMPYTEDTDSVIYKATNSAYKSDYGHLIPRLDAIAGQYYDITAFISVVDLTDMYGAGNEPTTVEQFLSDYPEFNDYVPYTEGALKSSEASGLQVNGANSWDEEWEVGGINVETGNNYQASDRIRGTSYCLAVPNTTYFFKTPNKTAYVVWYDANRNYISYGYGNNTPVISPYNARYFRFVGTVAYGTTYNHDIAIVLGTTGTYKPYRAPWLLDFGQTVSLDGIGDVKDEIRAVKQSDGSYTLELVKRITECTFTGNERFTEQASFADYTWSSFFWSDAKDAGAVYSDSFLCTILPYKGAFGNYLGALRRYGGIYFSYPNGSTISDFMTGAVVKYELATPIITTLRTGLTESQIATLIELYGSIEIVGNANKGFARPDATVAIDALKAAE